MPTTLTRLLFVCLSCAISLRPVFMVLKATACFEIISRVRSLQSDVKVTVSHHLGAPQLPHGKFGPWPWVKVCQVPIFDQAEGDVLTSSPVALLTCGNVERNELCSMMRIKNLSTCSMPQKIAGVVFGTSCTGNSFSLPLHQIDTLLVSHANSCLFYYSIFPGPRKSIAARICLCQHRNCGRGIGQLVAHAHFHALQLLPGLNHRTWQEPTDNRMRPEFFKNKISLQSSVV